MGRSQLKMLPPLARRMLGDPAIPSKSPAAAAHLLSLRLSSPACQLTRLNEIKRDYLGIFPNMGGGLPNSQNFCKLTKYFFVCQIHSEVLKHVLQRGGGDIWSILSPKVHLISFIPEKNIARIAKQPYLTSLLLSLSTAIKGCFSEYLFGQALSSQETPHQTYQTQIW